MKNIIIGVAGASGSGKTFFSKILSKKFRDSLILSQDNYYASRQDLTKNERNKLNFDDPSMVDWQLLLRHISLLKYNNPIPMPIYSFNSHARLKKLRIVKPRRLIIMEGIFALHNKKINNLLDLKLYMDADQDICFIRRLQRDIHERNRTIKSIISQYLGTVRPAFYKHVLPTKNNADVIIHRNNKEIFVKIKQLLKDC